MASTSSIPPTTNTASATTMDHTAPSPTTLTQPLSPPASPMFPNTSGIPLDAKVSHYTKPSTPPRFPRHPCPTPHYTLSLLSSEHEAQRLFGPDFTLRSPTTGELLGPFALLSYTDAWIPKYCRYIHNVVSTPVFTLREREIIVLAVASVTQAEYVVSSHARIAAAAGLGMETMEHVLGCGGWMDVLGLSGREKNVFRLASEMAGSWGRVGEETWRAVVVKDKPKAKGEEGWLEKEHEDVKMADVETGKNVADGVGGGIDSVDGKKGRVEKQEEKHDRLTREEVATLAQVLASTMFVSVLVNCAEVEEPHSEAEIVQQP